MLVLSRGPKDKVLFPNLGISVEIMRISGNRVHVGVDAPKDVHALRHELASTFTDSMSDDDSLDGESLSSGANSAIARLAAKTEQIKDRELRHRLRNRLNTAHLSLSLMEHQLNAGMHEEALSTLHRAMSEFDTLDGEMIENNEEEVSQPSSLRSPRTLLVEADATQSELLAGFLRLSGYEVDTAEDAIQAMVQLARRDPPDFVLLDMHVPRMNSAKTVESIRLNPQYQGVLLYAVTASEPHEIGIEIGPRGVDRWFSKPIKPQELVHSLNYALQSKPFRGKVSSG